MHRYFSTAHPPAFITSTGIAFWSGSIRSVLAPVEASSTTLMAFGHEPRLAALFVNSPFFDLRQLMNEELTRRHYPTFLAFGGLFLARLLGGVDLLAHSPQDAITHDAGRPIFVVHGTGDRSINVHHSRDLAKLAEQTGANVTTWFPEGVDHHPHAVLERSSEYEQQLTVLFRNALKK